MEIYAVTHGLKYVNIVSLVLGYDVTTWSIHVGVQTVGIPG